MKKLTLLVALATIVGAGCKKKKADQGGMTSGSSAMGSGSAAGSATGSAEGSATGSDSAGSAAAAKPLTGDEIAKRFEECWGYFNDAKWDDFKKCYAADATYEMPGSGAPAVSGADAIIENVKAFKAAFPDIKGDLQLVLVNGHEVAAVTLAKGTNSGAMKTPMGEMPATNQKVGLYTSQVMQVNDQGQATKEAEYIDMGTMMGQLKPDKKHPVRPVMDKLPMAKVVVVAKDDATEKANLEAVKKMNEAFNKHDVKALGATLDDKSVWSEQASPKDLNKKQNLANTQKLWKSFSDAKIDADHQWAAGDFVVTTGKLEGTNDGDMPEMHLKKTGKKISAPFLEIDQLDKGKISHTWLFYQSGAIAQQLGLMPPAGGAAAKPGDKAAAKKPAKKHGAK